MKLVLLSDDAFDRLKGLLRVSDYFEPDPGAIDDSMRVDAEIVADIKLAVPVAGEPGPVYERIRREVGT